MCLGKTFEAARAASSAAVHSTRAANHHSSPKEFRLLSSCALELKSFPIYIDRYKILSLIIKCLH